MFTANLKIRDGIGRWASGLGALLRRKGPETTREATERQLRPEPKTEGERALYQAMGWKENGWDDLVDESVDDLLR